MEALESKLEGGKEREKTREEQLSEDVESMFKTKVRWDHVVGKHKKMSKVLDEF